MHCFVWTSPIGLRKVIIGSAPYGPDGIDGLEFKYGEGFALQCIDVVEVSPRLRERRSTGGGQAEEPKRLVRLMALRNFTRVDATGIRGAALALTRLLFALTY